MTSEAYITPGRSKVYYVQTVTTATAPTNLELAAGMDLSPALRGMPQVPRSATPADSSDLSSEFEKRVRGTVGGDAMSMEFKRKLGTETQLDVLDEGDFGYIAIFRKGLAGTTPSVGDKCDFYPVQVNTIGPGSPGRTDVDTELVEFLIYDDPIRDYSVVST